MLQRLYVKNVALISEADVDFDGKLNILSGETGSGKSVILDSINFVLGSKADKNMIRYGEQEMSVRAEFFVEEGSEALKKLKDLDVDSDGEIVITRKLTADGKSAIKINGNAVTASMLKSVTQHLVDVHGQSEHFFLLSEDNQLKTIDALLGENAQRIKEELAALISEKRSLKSKISELGGDESERERQLDLLNYQINEIENANLKVGEFEELTVRQNVIANTERILTALSAVRSVLDDENGCADGISTAKHYVNGISALSDAYAQIGERLESLGVEIKDISETVTDFTDELNFDSREAEEIDERLSLIKSLKKKYGADESEILEFCEKARAKADVLSDGACVVEKYTAEIAAIDEKIYELCKKLTALRKEVAEKFCKEVIAELKTLNIPNANFAVEFAEYDEGNANLSSSNGSDSICFNFSANKGEPLKPLSKVISGGEMSRFMLAVKTRLKDVNGISTYIFDEIDAGISGFTATTVAEKFVKISKHTQILAVSHLPQVCAASDAQFLIYKVEESGKTLTKVKRLAAESKIEEIVRLTGSVNSVAAREHAIELIKQIKK